jgi:hypothetical protein
MKEGNINMQDLTASPQLMEYVNYSAERGRNSDPKPFASTLRSSDHKPTSRSNSKNKTTVRPLTATDSSFYAAPKESIIEEDEEEGTTLHN